MLDENTPVFDPSSPAAYFFCAHCGQVLPDVGRPAGGHTPIDLPRELLRVVKTVSPPSSTIHPIESPVFLGTGHPLGDAFDPQEKSLTLW